MKEAKLVVPIIVALVCLALIFFLLMFRNSVNVRIQISEGISSGIEEFDQGNYSEAFKWFNKTLSIAEKYDRAKSFSKRFSFGDVQAIIHLWCSLSLIMDGKDKASLDYLIMLDNKMLMSNLLNKGIFFWRYDELNQLMKYADYR
ncbi:hypothetical protein D6777_03990, partial [Candidatus Woesearchaeota archaeon]